MTGPLETSTAPWSPSLAEVREAAFQRHIETHVRYFETIVSNGDLPWFAAGNPKRDRAIEHLGLAEDVSETELRRAFFMARYPEEPNSV